MPLALLHHKQQLALSFLAPLDHDRVRQEEDLFSLVHIDEMGELELANEIDDGVLLIFGHDELKQVHVLATEDRHLFVCSFACDY